jgi:DNA modification methylase
MKKNELDKKIWKLLSSDNQVIKKDLITFYWTRKDPNLLLNIVDIFTNDGDVLYDPFLGSAPILFGIDQSKKDIRFIGSEINEMPLSFIKFNLDHLSDKDLKEIKNKYIPFYEKYIHLFQYQNPRYNEKITVSKVIIDREEDDTRVTKFFFTGKDKFSLSKGEEGFNECEREHLIRYKKLSATYIEDDFELITNTRIAVKEGMMLSHLFNPINFYLLKEFTREFHNNKLMMNILSSVLHLCRLTDLKSQSQFPYWVPKKDIVERNILVLILKKIDEIIKGKANNTLNLVPVKNFSLLKENEKSVLIINKPSQSINESDIPDKSVDCVITDPPYFDQVAYSEYLKIWEHICKLKSNLKDEIVLSNRKIEPSSEEQYLTNLTRCFTAVGNKLKDDGLAIIFFKDSKPKNIHLFLSAMENSNFSFIRSVHIGNKKFTYKQNTTQDTTVGGECLFFFEKNCTGEKTTHTTKEISYSQMKEKLKQVVLDFVSEYLHKNKRATLGELYDNGLLLRLYKKNMLRQISSSKIVVEILNENFTLLEDRNYVIE